MGLEKVIRLRVSDEVYEQLKKRADATGESISDYIRRSIGIPTVGRTRPNRIEPEELELYRQLTYELNRIGNNLNQIARALNQAMKVAPSEEFFSTMKEGVEGLKDLQVALKEILEELREKQRSTTPP